MLPSRAPVNSPAVPVDCHVDAELTGPLPPRPPAPVWRVPLATLALEPRPGLDEPSGWMDSCAAAMPPPRTDPRPCGGELVEAPSAAAGPSASPLAAEVAWLAAWLRLGRVLAGTVTMHMTAPKCSCAQQHMVHKRTHTTR